MDNAPIQAPVSSQQGIVSRIWALFFTSVVDRLNGKFPVPVPQYTVSTVPVAANNKACIIYVSNEAGGATIAFSDGSNWRRVQDRAIVS